MIDYLNPKTRIKLIRFYLPALESVIALQRRKWYGWKTTSWIYPSIMKNAECNYIREWLEWNETFKEEKMSEYEKGREIMTKCENKFLCM